MYNLPYFTLREDMTSGVPRLKSKTFLFYAALFFALPVMFTSCMSTRVYEKTNSMIFQDEELIGEEFVLTLDGRTLESSSRIYRSTGIDGTDGLEAKSVTEKKSGSRKETTTISVFHGDELVEEKKFRSRNGIIEENDVLYGNSRTMRRAYDSLSNMPVSDGGKQVVVVSSENVRVESTPNVGYIMYSIFGKPFVILGSTVWNITRCAGFALVNFIGGYTTARYGEFLWLMPDVKKAAARADAARVKNSMVYPEYHLPFTDNHIAVKKMKTEVSNEFSASEPEVKVMSSEEFEYDNTLSVSRSAAADADATTSVIGLAGTVSTIPVSAVTWVGGAAYGIWASSSR